MRCVWCDAGVAALSILWLAAFASPPLPCSLSAAFSTSPLINPVSPSPSTTGLQLGHGGTQDANLPVMVPALSRGSINTQAFTQEAQPGAGAPQLQELCALLCCAPDVCSCAAKHAADAPAPPAGIFVPSLSLSLLLQWWLMALRQAIGMLWCQTACRRARRMTCRSSPTLPNPSDRRCEASRQPEHVPAGGFSPVLVPGLLLRCAAL